MRRRAVIFFLAGVLLVSASGCLFCGGLFGGLFPGLFGNNLTLMADAERIVSQDYPNSLLVEAIGSASSGAAMVAGDVDQWEFRFLDDRGLNPPNTVIINYADEQFGDPVFIPDTLLGTVFEPLPRQMTLAEAIRLMRNAGYSDAFAEVIFRKPLTWPQPEEALYIFPLPGRFVLVGALTGEVNEEVRQ